MTEATKREQAETAVFVLESAERVARRVTIALQVAVVILVVWSTVDVLRGDPMTAYAKTLLALVVYIAAHAADVFLRDTRRALSNARISVVIEANNERLRHEMAAEQFLRSIVA